MKYTFLIILFFPLLLIGQDLDKTIDSLKIVNSQLKVQIDHNLKLIADCNSKKLQTKALAQNLNPFYYKVDQDTYIFKEASLTKGYIEIAKTGDSLEIFNYKDKFFSVRYHDYIGFVSQYVVPANHQVANLRRAYLLSRLNEDTSSINRNNIQNLLEDLDDDIRVASVDSLAKLIRFKEIEEQKKEEEKRLNDLKTKPSRMLKKYGPVIGKKINDGLIWIGMTSEMAIDSWGAPDDINRTVTRYVKHEQWIYGSQYLYFEDGKLTGWQD